MNRLKESLRLIYVISSNVYHAASKERLLYGFLILSIFFVLLATVPFLIEHTPAFGELFQNAQPKAMALQIGFAWINIFLMLISIFISLNVLQVMLSQDTLSLLLSKPIQRWQIIEGIFFGLFRISFLNWFIMASSLWLIVYYNTGEIDNAIWLGTSVSLVLVMIYISLVVFFYTLIPNAISGILSFFIIIAGFGTSLSGISLSDRMFHFLPRFFTYMLHLGFEALPKINSLFGVSMKLLHIFALEEVNMQAVLVHSIVFLIVIHLFACFKFSRST